MLGKFEFQVAIGNFRRFRKSKVRTFVPQTECHQFQDLDVALGDWALEIEFSDESEKNLMSFASGKAKDSDMDPEAKRKKLLGIK